MDLETWLSVVAGLPVGLLTSLLLLHGVRPKLRWREEIECRPTTDGQPEDEYAVSFRNAGWRAATDVQVYARMRVRGLRGAKRWLVFEVPTNNRVIPYVEPSKRPFRRERGRRRVLVLQLRDVRQGDLLRLPVEVADGIRSGALAIPHVLALGLESELLLDVICSDALSGARHVSSARPLTAGDIRRAT